MADCICSVGSYAAHTAGNKYPLKRHVTRLHEGVFTPQCMAHDIKSFYCVGDGMTKQIASTDRCF